MCGFCFFVFLRESARRSVLEGRGGEDGDRRSEPRSVRTAEVGLELLNRQIMT